MSAESILKRLIVQYVANRGKESQFISTLTVTPGSPVWKMWQEAINEVHPPTQDPDTKKPNG